MRIHQLRYFCAVAKAGNFSRASEREPIAQRSPSQPCLQRNKRTGGEISRFLFIGKIAGRVAFDRWSA
jgi:LysR family transcriptional regulator, hydrogen peroxide-inducible genes activator